jgi:3-isopropylmalate/(R)-2-methylmalate dehydratase large subunit
VQVETLKKNTAEYGIEHFGLGNPNHGIVHVVGPELGLTQPGITIVCGDSHTATHGAFGAVAFGIGTSEVEMVMATQCIMQPKPKNMLIKVNGELGKGVTAKDIILYVISKLGTGGGTGYFVEFSGSAIMNLSMEGRMTVSNMAIEMGARGGFIPPDETTFNYIQGRPYAPKGEKWDEAIEKWKQLYSDDDAKWDAIHEYEAADIKPMITYGTNPGMGLPIDGHIPEESSIEKASLKSFSKSLEYMGFKPGDKMLGKKVDYVFVGSCTNGRIEDFKQFADFVKGKKKAENVVVWLVPGSKSVEEQCNKEGVTEILNGAGFELREPGCSACLAMNEDKVPEGKYSVSTTNRNFEGRQGPGARTMLASPLVAAAAAITGVVTDPREMM